jgi:ABC-2 type transport system ATP-binding protein
MLEVNNLTKQYGKKTVLDHVSFQADVGEIVGFLGPNGAGKSTTMNIITGNLAATDGTVKVDGNEILESPIQVKRKLGYLPEVPPLYPDMTVEGYLNFTFQLKKCRFPRKDYVTHICEVTQISEMRSRLIRNLSKGYRQRVGIAQALIGNPELLILDEPTDGLDPKQIIEIRQLIHELRKQHTILFSSHILSEVQAVCDRIIVLDQGRLLADDTPANLSRKLSDNCFIISVKGPEEAVREALQKLSGVRNVRLLQSTRAEESRFEVETNENTDVRLKAAKFFKQSPWLMTGLMEEELSLESIFLKLTDEKRGDARN